jgi:hypothetical protein
MAALFRLTLIPARDLIDRPNKTAESWGMSIIKHTDKGVPAEWVSSSNSDGLIVPAAQPVKRTRIEVKWHKTVDYLAPIGYEDDSGFHYGEMSASIAAMNSSKSRFERFTMS